MIDAQRYSIADLLVDPETYNDENIVCTDYDNCQYRYTVEADHKYIFTEIDRYSFINHNKACQPLSEFVKTELVEYEEIDDDFISYAANTFAESMKSFKEEYSERSRIQLICELYFEMEL